MRGSLPLLVLLVAPAGAAAQSGPQLRAGVQLFTGLAVGSPNLWTIARQPVVVPGTEASPLYDTLALGRAIHPGLTAGVGLVVFPTAHFGVAGRLTVVGMEIATRCAGVYYHAFGMRHDNEALCARMQGQTRSLGMAGLELQGVARAAPNRAVSPYMRLGASALYYSASTVSLEGTEPTGTRIVIDDPDPASLAVALALGAGLAVTYGRGLQVTLDAGESWYRLPAVTGPASPTARAPTARRSIRQTVVTLGLTAVLDATHRRRY